MKVILVVGGKGTGKTTYVKACLSQVHEKARMVYDVNNEYKDLYPYDILPINTFKEKVSNVSNAMVVFDEATISFPNRGYDKNIVDLLVRTRHTNNITFLVYHTIRSIPIYIYNLSNHIVLFKTGEDEYIIDKKYNDLLETFLIVKKNESYHFRMTIERM